MRVEYLTQDGRYVPEEVFLQPEPTLEQRKASRKIDADRVYLSRLVSGYFDTETGLTLAAEQHDQNVFGNYLQLKEVAQTGDSTLVPLADKFGIPHEITYAQFKALMLRYGAWCEQQWGAVVVVKAMISAALDDTALEAIVYE